MADNINGPGPLFIDLNEPYLSDTDKLNLKNPMVGGVILFKRNFINNQQIKQLCHHIKSINPYALVAVDNEGGPVQRFCDDKISSLPPVSLLGAMYNDGLPLPEVLKFAESCAIVMAYELRVLGVDLSFAPVLDVANKDSSMLTGRCFHHNPDIISAIATSYIMGMNKVSMPAVGKHFPGHGGVSQDSHFELPYDERSANDIHQDLKPYNALIQAGILPAVMSAHVVYKSLSLLPASFCPEWLEGVLRDKMQFNGVVFSDDLNMLAVREMDCPISRFTKSLAAGNDFVLLCNNPNDLNRILNEAVISDCSTQSRRRMKFWQQYAVTNNHNITALEDLYNYSKMQMNIFQSKMQVGYA